MALLVKAQVNSCIDTFAVTEHRTVEPLQSKTGKVGWRHKTGYVSHVGTMSADLLGQAQAREGVHGALGEGAGDALARVEAVRHDLCAPPQGLHY